MSTQVCKGRGKGSGHVVLETWGKALPWEVEDLIQFPPHPEEGTALSHFPVFSLDRYGVTLHPSYCRKTSDSPDEASMNPKNRQAGGLHVTCSVWAAGKLGFPLRSECVNSLGNL